LRLSAVGGPIREIPDTLLNSYEKTKK